MRLMCDEGTDVPDTESTMCMLNKAIPFAFQAGSPQVEVAMEETLYRKVL